MNPKRNAGELSSDSAGGRKLLEAEEREVQEREKKRQLENKEEMRQVEKVFRLIHEYCKENLNISYNLLDKHIEDLLEPSCTVSPLLKYFNDLVKSCNFRLPSRSLLKFDQKFFKKYVQRLREAQKVEVKWVRKSVVNESRKTLMRAFDEARGLMQEEIKHILYNFDDLKAQLRNQEKENLKLQQKIVDMEVIIKEQRTFVNATISKKFQDDEELFKLNGGAGGAYEKFIYGNVVQNIEQYHEVLKNHIQGMAEDIKLTM